MSDYATGFVNGIFNKNIYEINKNLNKHLSILSSLLIIKSDSNENIYIASIAQLFSFFGVFFKELEEDSRKGKLDYGFPNIYNYNEYILMEAKVSKKDDEDSLHKICINAIKQIETKDFEAKHRKEGYTNIIKYGIALCGSTCKVEMKINNGEIQSS